MNHRLVLLICLLLTPLAAIADTVDNFTVPQGPITVSPGETASETEGTMFAAGVLGGFRVMAPAVDEDGAPGATATAQIGGGEFTCSVNLEGGCAVGWAPDQENTSFDMRNAGAFELNVLEADPGAALVVFLINGTVDINTVVTSQVSNSAITFIENPAPGSYTLPVSEFVPVSLDPLFEFDFGTVTNVVLAAAYIDGFDGTLRLGPVTTTGPIGNGPEVEPPDLPGDEELIRTISGTYYNPMRSGEGCQITLEGDEQTFILTCYFFLDGEQAWVIGSGFLVGGEIDFIGMTITSGADFGDDFNPDDVVRTPWGEAGMAWNDCNNATLTLLPVVPGFSPINLDLTKITPDTCTVPEPTAEPPSNEGTFYDTARSGEGLQVARQGDSNVYVVTWYTYLDGKQVWLIGTGTRQENRLVFDDMIITSGTGFGPDFNPDDVVREPWGTLTLDYTDCNNASATATPLPGQTAFAPLEVDVRKLVTGICP